MSASSRSRLAHRFGYPDDDAGQTLARVAQYVAVMKGSGPALRRAPRAARAGHPADRRPSLLRVAPAGPARARRPAPATRDDELRPCARARLRGGRRGVRRRLLHRGGAAAAARFCHIAPGRHGDADRTAEHVRDRARPRAPDGHPEAPRRAERGAAARVGELRRHRGRLHRLPRAGRRRERRARLACSAAPPEPLPLPRLHDGRLEPARRAQPALGRPAAQLPLVGRAAGARSRSSASSGGGATSTSSRRRSRPTSAGLGRYLEARAGAATA